jgi:hypothetical protein
MIYTYDKELLIYKKTHKTALLFLVALFGILVLAFATIFSTKEDCEVVLTEEVRVIVLREYNEFSEEKLDEYLKELNIKFPNIVKAQSQLETGYYSSEVFKVNHNLFGMKVAKLRPTTALGENLGHAYYHNWRSSVLDYAFYSTAYLRDLKTEEDYYAYLSANYAEDPNYIIKLKTIVE